MRVTMRASTRLVNPGSAFGSNTTVGNPRRTAASIIGPGGVSANAERRGKLVPAQNRKRIPHRRRKLRSVAREFHPADALESRRANRLERKPGLGHQARFNPALRSDEHDFPFSFPRHPFPRDGQRRKNVAARAAAGDQQFQSSLPRIITIASLSWRRRLAGDFSILDASQNPPAGRRRHNPNPPAG